MDVPIGPHCSGKDLHHQLSGFEGWNAGLDDVEDPTAQASFPETRVCFFWGLGLKFLSPKHTERLQGVRAVHTS